jgi:DNA-binding response OmpR family regulator
MQVKVLLIGHDNRLLETRRLLLQHENYNVVTKLSAASLMEAECQNLALAILCHTLSSGGKRLAIQAVRQISPRVMILHLRTSDTEVELPEHASSSVIEGPAELLAAARDLIRRWRDYLA